MRALFALALAAMLTLGTGAAGADETAIQAVIEDQIAAFQRDDVVSAFEHASPSIQGKFGDAARFGEMVQSGYPMIWRPERYKMLGTEETPLGPRQTVLFVDRAGEYWEADYLMRLVDGRWRIAGVTLRRAPGISS